MWRGPERRRSYTPRTTSQLLEHRSDINSGSVCPDNKGDDAPASSETETKRSEHEKQGVMIPCNAVWAQLSFHPNIEFADLSLLADVGARRDHIHIASSSSSTFSSFASTACSTSGAPVVTTSDHTSSAQYSASVPQTQEGTRWLVPQDHLILNGLGHRRRVRQVPNNSSAGWHQDVNLTSI
jgi:hypothetical protein